MFCSVLVLLLTLGLSLCSLSHGHRNSESSSFLALTSSLCAEGYNVAFGKKIIHSLRIHNPDIALPFRNKATDGNTSLSDCFRVPTASTAPAYIAIDLENSYQIYSIMLHLPEPDNRYSLCECLAHASCDGYLARSLK
ncbi:hypothetical protein Ciccas_004411 [Cichlidogyrus casuarinus]|uniref:Uncharacterized protein n=1 Tax=Cichlidogyrus casuarinus TaxID=1844966 RepID=A0ABD2QC25_9PLAT